MTTLTSRVCQKSRCICLRIYPLLPNSLWKHASCLFPVQNKKNATRIPSYIVRKVGSKRMMQHKSTFISFVFLALMFCICSLYSSKELRAENYDTEQWVLYFERFEHPEIFKATYEEEKHIPALLRPLRSSGMFFYIRGTGLAWFMSQPFEMKTVISDQGLSQWLLGKKQPQSEEAKKIISPILKNISALFSGDFKQLSNHFIVKEVPSDEGNWSLTLMPRDIHLKLYLQRIEISGGRYIESLKVVYAKDKYTIVTYGKPKVGTEYITRMEKNVFQSVWMVMVK